LAARESNFITLKRFDTAGNANELQVSRTLITSDVQYLRKQAKEKINHYFEEDLPEQFSICLTSLENIIKDAHNIFAHAEDGREKLQALELVKSTQLEKLSLLGDADMLQRAMSYVKSKHKQQPAQEDKHQPEDAVIEQAQEQQEQN
jgi:hypothetical protein